MKPHFNKTWFLIAIVIIVNVVIFKFVSIKLESFVENSVATSNLSDSL